jgi:very-short-patch-repair endonuclease
VRRPAIAAAHFGDGWRMLALDQVIRRHDYFLRRRDLLARGFSDHQIRQGLGAGRIFRVRHGWYSVPDAPAPAILAVRVGGRLTSISALETYGLRVPNRDDVHVAVRASASRLRNPQHRRERLRRRDPVRIHWNDRPSGGGSVWRASIADALLVVLNSESREIAVACCSAAMRHKKLSWAALDAVFRRAQSRVTCLRGLVSALDDSHGETYARLGFLDAGIQFEQQPYIRGAGQLDFKVGPHSYVEVDGGQHDPAWTGEGQSNWQKDLDRRTTMAIRGDRVEHYSYLLLYTQWPRVLAAIQRMIADDLALTALRRRHPHRPSALRKRRSSAQKPLW